PVQSTSTANLDRIAQNRRFAATGADRAAVRAMVEAAEADGTRVSMEYGSVWIAMSGEDQESARTHRTIGVPGATTELTGLSDSPNPAGAWIMAAGTGAAHIMIPGT
ncbi:MAG: hypothetical protein ACC682_13365, partial [Gemmatimonadota bacterium]